MNFDDTPDEAAFRAEVRAWLEANAPAHLFDLLSKPHFGFGLVGIDTLAESRAWQARKFAAGWACLQWPKDYGGRGASPIERVIWGQEEGPYSALSRVFFIGQNMCGPTLMTYADEAQKQRLLPPMAAGEEIWCQLFSEPAGGSDLAALRTRAERDGDDWVINGQKIWTSGAQHSDYGLLLTRSDPSKPKHKGLTMFFVRMDSPGIEVRPIRQANGDRDFNEVFFKDVRIPDSQRLGPENGGWQVALTTLMNERFSVGAGAQTGFPQILALCQTLATADGRPAIEDPAVRSKLANWACRHNGLRYTGFRAISALSQGKVPGPENSIGKLVAGSTMQEIAAFALDLQAQGGIVVDPSLAAAEGRFQAMMLRAPAVRVEGGTDEILRNIIAERVLGLPPDIRVDKDGPFNQNPATART